MSSLHEMTTCDIGAMQRYSHYFATGEGGVGGEPYDCDDAEVDGVLQVLCWIRGPPIGRKRFLSVAMCQ